MSRNIIEGLIDRVRNAFNPYREDVHVNLESVEVDENSVNNSVIVIRAQLKDINIHTAVSKFTIIVGIVYYFDTSKGEGVVMYGYPAESEVYVRIISSGKTVVTNDNVKYMLREGHVYAYINAAINLYYDNAKVDADTYVKSLFNF